MFDLVIRGGHVADGLGGALQDADVAVKDGLIAAIGPGLARGTEEIDAKGKLVTPGFIDIHTHYDGQAIWDQRLQPSSWHGVTTAVMGNCGVGFAPVRPGDQDRLIALMEGVEDIPGAVLAEGLDWAWESFPDYLDRLDARTYDMDIAAQVPHGALRLYVMGARGAALEPATPEDIAQMRALTAAAMAAGALGVSTSRTLNHRTASGDPTPSLRAREDELMGLALGLQDAGAGAIELISDFPDLDHEFAMIERLANASGRPISISLAQAHRAPDGWRALLAKIGDAAAQGLAIKAQVAPRPIGLLFGLQGTLHPFLTHPSYAAIAAQPLAARAKALLDPDFRAKLLAEAPQSSNAMFISLIQAFANMYPLGDPPNYEPAPSTSLAAQAAREGRDVREVALDHLGSDDGRAFLFAPFANYAGQNLDPCGAMIGDANTLMGLGDGGAHVGIISDASFPTYLLTHWGRDRSHGRFDPAWLIKRLTHDNAMAMGCKDRGRLAVGLRADLNVIDFDHLQVEAPRMAYDLPSGGKRLLQGARGYDATLVAGQITYRHGEATDALPGRLIRGVRSAAN